MAVLVELPQVAGHQPAVDNRLSGKLGVVEIARHNRFTAHANFTDAVASGIDNANFHPRQRLANRIGAKRLQIIDGDGGTGSRKAVAIGNGNSQIVEKLQYLRLRERATDDNRAQLASECLVNLFQQHAADAEARLALRQHLVDGNERVENFSFATGQSVESCLQAFLQIL